MDLLSQIIDRNRSQRDEADRQNSRWVDAFMNSESDLQYDAAIREIFQSEGSRLRGEAGQAGVVDGADRDQLPAEDITGDAEKPAG